MSRSFLILAFIFLSINLDTIACTTFLVSGKYTPDGRPLLFKHRDTSEPNNALALFSDGKYKYVGMVNATKSWSSEVWGGFNETGFAIINSAAYTNNVGDTTKLADMEGVLMKKALQYCANLSDFENLLDSVSRPMGVDANFGVIDALGGAAYYETGNSGYRKVDANDPLLAPHGFLIRTNHSFGRHADEGYGYIRYQTAQKVLDQAAAMNRWEPQSLINSISRNLTHSLTGDCLTDHLPETKDQPVFHFFNDFIPRESSTSSMLVVGAPSGGNASQTMMWSLVGFPLTTPAIPVWLDEKLPELVTMNETGHAPICDASLVMKKQCFPIERGSGSNYINLSVLFNKNKDGYLQQVKKAEAEIFRRTNQLLADTKGERPTAKKLRDFYTSIHNWLNSFYNEKLGIDF